MALDAATLHLCAYELGSLLVDARVDKIFQPTRDEVILGLRSRTASHRLLVSARSGSARVCVTKESYENPMTPPSYCMLLRKHLTGGRLLAVNAVPNERIVFFEFQCTNEMGDLVRNTLAVELMGRYCNLVLVGPEGPSVQNSKTVLREPTRGDLRSEARNGATAPQNAAARVGEQAVKEVGRDGVTGRRITDALKRVDFEDSEVRQLLPGLPYTLPPKPDKLDFITAEPEDILARMEATGLPPADALRKVCSGVGPVVLREAAHRAFGAAEPQALDGVARAALLAAMGDIRADYQAGGKPCMVKKPDGAPAEFSFTRLTQYLPDCTLVEFDDFSTMLEGYYATKDRAERLRQKSKELRKAVHNMYERAVRKQAARQEERQQGEKSDGLRIAGELLTANLHAFQKGDASVTVSDWYNGGAPTAIKLDPRLTPSQNAQKYFKEYKKKQTAARMLTQLLEQGEKEIEYLGTVLYEVDAARGEAELGEIRAELKSQGYLKYYKQRDKRQKPQGFITYTSSDGFTIHVGRNNAQNERLSLKTARGKDLWFHVKNAPGSHVVVMSEGQDIPLPTQNEAAMLAVWHSSQKNSAKVPVDYTMVKNLRKTGDLPPGMVLYENYETAYITPDSEALRGLGAVD